jgi:hypothetical protein
MFARAVTTSHGKNNTAAITTPQASSES